MKNQDRNGGEILSLKEMRKKSGLTCEALAAACGVSVYTIRAYECGARQMSAETLFRASKALGASMEEIFQACNQRRAKGVSE